MKHCIHLLIILITISCSNSSQEQIELKFNLPVGARFQQAMSMTMDMTQQMMGQPVSMQNAITITYIYEALSDSSGWKKLSSTITNVKVDISGMGEEMHYDSDSALADTSSSVAMIGRLFGSMKGSTFYYTINEKGQVGTVTGFEEMQQKMRAAMPGNPPGLMPFNEEGFRQNMQQAFAAYPPHPIKKGSSWKTTTTTKLEGMDVVSENVYTLQSVKSNKAIIQIKSQLKSTGAAAIQGTEMDMSGESSGHIQYDVVTGMPVEGVLDTKMHVKLKSSDTEMPMSMNMKTTISGTKL